MTTPSAILLQLQTQLKAASALSYVQDANIFLGVRDQMISFPFVYIEPRRIEETVIAFNRKELSFYVVVVGVVKVLDKDKDNLIADSSTKGILNLENDLKLAIDDDATLQGLVRCIEIVETTYEYYDYPFRSVNIEIKIDFSQRKQTRS